MKTKATNCSLSCSIIHTDQRVSHGILPFNLNKISAIPLSLMPPNTEIKRCLTMVSGTGPSGPFDPVCNCLTNKAVIVTIIKKRGGKKPTAYCWPHSGWRWDWVWGEEEGSPCSKQRRHCFSAWDMLSWGDFTHSHILSAHDQASVFHTEPQPWACRARPVWSPGVTITQPASRPA